MVLDVNQEAHIATWKVAAADVAHEGWGYIQLIYVVDDVIAKSLVWETRIAPSLDNSEEPPEPYQAWVDEVLEAAADIVGMSVEVNALPPGASPTVTYSDGLMSFSLPVGGGGASDWQYIQNKPFETIGDGLSVDQQGVLSSDGASTWSEVSQKPFETVGSGLSVTQQGALTADAPGAEIHIGSDTPSGTEVLWINDTPSAVNVPQINDAVTSLVDTWSSSKISSEIPVIVALTQEEYDDLNPPDPDTYYFIYEEEEP